MSAKINASPLATIDHAHAGADTETVAPPAMSQRWWVLAVVVAAQFMFVVDAFIVNVAIPSIQADLQASAGQIEAVIALYQVAYASLVITGGRLGDILGRKRVFVSGVLAFTAASLWCGMAGSGAELVLARLVQGAMAALMVPQVLATIHTLFPAAGRTRAFAVFGIALGLGGAAGFALGGLLVTLDVLGLEWRSVFLVNLPIGAAIALAAQRLMPRVARRPGTRLDLAGAAVLFLSLTCLIGPVMAGHQLGWPVWLWAVMAAGAVMLGLFPRLERTVERRSGLPLIDLALLSDRKFLRGLRAAFSFHFGNVSFYLVMTFFTQNELRFSPLEGGLAVMPLALAFTLASQLAGRWAVRDGIAVLLWGSMGQLAGIIALGGLAGIPAQPGTAALTAALAMFGFGQGLVMAPLAGMVLATVQPAHGGSGAGLLNTIQQAAGAVGVSCVGAAYVLGGTADRRGVLAALALLGLSTLATIVLLARMGQGRSAGRNF